LALTVLHYLSFDRHKAVVCCGLVDVGMVSVTALLDLFVHHEGLNFVLGVTCIALQVVALADVF